MEGAGGSWAVGGGGGHVLGSAAQEPRVQRQDEKHEAAAAERKKGGAGVGGGGMKFRVSARAPHGVGALLLIGGAAVVGAAVLAWRRRSRHGSNNNNNDKGGAAVDQPDDHQSRLPAKQEPLEGGIVEEGKVQGASLVQKLDQSDEKLCAGNTDIGSGALDGNVSEESHQIHKEDEISEDRLVISEDRLVISEDRLESKLEEKIDENSGSSPVVVHTHNLESKHEEKIDTDSGSNPVEVHKHDLERKHEEKIDEMSDLNPVEVHTDDLDKEHVEKVEQKSSFNHVEITAHDMYQDNEHVEKIDHVKGIDQNSSRNPVKINMQEMVNVYLVSGSLLEKVEKDSSKDIEKDIAQKENKDIEAPDQSKFCIKGPGIILSRHIDIQEAESMENTPTAQLIMHQDQLLDETEDTVTETEEDTVTETEDTVTETEDTITATEDRVTETEEAKQGERTTTDKSELEQDEKKDLVGLVELASSPALPSLVKPIVKKEPEFPRPESGMKIEQDYTNGELREHTDLMSKGGAMQGGDMATMGCRSSALVVIALIFALAMGITIIVRLYAPSRATKLQMDLP